MFISDVITIVAIYRPSTLSYEAWDGSLTVGAVTIGAVTQGGVWTVQPGNTANTTAWKVDGSAVTQPVSAASLPLPAGAATQATLASALTELQSILTKLNASLAVTGTFFQATQPVSGTFFQATQPISAASLPLPTDAATQTTLALIKAKTDNLDALLSSLATQATLALLLSRADTFKTRSDTYTAAPTSGVTVDASASPLSAFGIQVKATGAVTSWDVRLEGSLNNVDFTTLLTHTNVTGDGVVLWSGTLEAPTLYFRSRVVGLVGGTNVVVTILGQN